jgi:thioredoxin reductase
MSRTDLPRIAILGAGPIGLEAALHAATLGLPFAVYERGRVGEHLRQWGHVRLFSPFGMNVTPLGRSRIQTDNPAHQLPADNDLLTGREHLAAYLEPLAKSPFLRDHVHAGTSVLHVGRRGCLKDDAPGDGRRPSQPFLLLLRGPDNKERVEEADVVFDCTGTYGRHRWLGDGGIPARGELAAQNGIAYGLEDVLGERQEHYADRNVLVIGGGYSAATAVCNLAALAEKNPGTWVIWLARATSTQPIKRIANDPLRERDRLAVRANTLATRGDGNVEFHGQTVVDAVDHTGPERGFKVTARKAGKPLTWDVERVIANVGYAPDAELYRELHVHECYASQGPMNLAAALLKHAGGDCLTMPPAGAAALRNPEPNFFVLGSKSYGRNPHFLMHTGFEQVREVFTLIAGDAELKKRFPSLVRCRLSTE